MWGLIRGGRKNFFFEKKEKLLDIGAAPVRPDRLQTNKSFLVLFFKKELLSYQMPVPPTVSAQRAAPALCFGGLPKRSPPYGRRLSPKYDCQQ
jgi:hypothetical protein